MKKYIFIIAATALLAACGQKTETAAPEASPIPTATPETAANTAADITPTPTSTITPPLNGPIKATGNEAHTFTTKPSPTP